METAPYEQCLSACKLQQFNFVYFGYTLFHDFVYFKYTKFYDFMYLEYMKS